MNYIKKLKEVNLFNSSDYYNSGEPGFVSIWDFSKANFNHEARVQAVSAVASVCYGNDSLDPKFKLFDKLARESIGLPSSSFEFIPVLLNGKKVSKIIDYYSNNYIPKLPKILKFGYRIDEENDNYILTNLRALWIDIKEIQKKDKTIPDIDNEIWYNNDDEEIKIISNNFIVFNKKITIRDARQFNRHRISLQELSRRYTTGNKVPIEYRIKLFRDDLDKKVIKQTDACIMLYNELLENKVPAQYARDILPVSIYTKIWSAWTPEYLDNFFKLRTASSSQSEVRELAIEMQKLYDMIKIKDNKNKENKENKENND